MNLKQTWGTVKERIPITKAYKDRKQTTYVEKIVTGVKQEDDKTKVQNILKDSGGTVDVEEIKRKLTEAPQTSQKQEQQGTTGFKNILADAIIYGYTRTEGTTSDVGIRRAVRSEEFITAIETATADSPLATPIEGESSKYAGGMQKVRKELAGKLKSGNVGKLSSNELDIILTGIFTKNEKGGPLFREVYLEFFVFLEIAACTSPRKEGEYIRDTLLALTTMNTMDEDLKMQTTCNLADTGLIDRTLASIADPMIEKAVGLFNDSMGSVLSTPTTELHQELGVPGLGYFCKGTEVGNAMTGLKNAASAEAVASIAHKNAVNTCTTANTQENQQIVKDAEAALNSATARKEAAGRKLLQLVPELNGMTEEKVQAHIAGLIQAAKEVEQLKQIILNKYTDAFRLAFIDYRRENKPMDDAALEKLGDNGHPLVVSLIAEIREVTKLRTEQGQDKTTAKVDALARRIDTAQLPQEVKADLIKFVKSLTNAEAETCKMEKCYAYPVRKVAAHAMKEYSEVRTGSIPDEQWITARVGFQGKVSLMSLPEVKPEKGILRNLKNDLHIYMHFKLPKDWTIIFALPVLPVKWFLDATVWNNDLKARIKEQRIKYTDEKNERRPSYFKNKHWGWAKVATAVFIVGEIIAATIGSVNYNEGFWKGVTRHFLRMPWNYVSVAPGSGIRLPNKWFTPQPTNADRKTIDDSYDIPKRLAGRGHKYYQEAYGVGIGVAPEATKRLDWLESHPGVLQYFQERTSNRKVVPTEEMPKGWTNYPKILGNKPDGKPIFSITYNKAEGDTSAAGTPDTVWNTLYMNTVPIADGLVLNKVNSDRFVDTLMAMEKSGANGHGFLGERNVLFGNRKLDYRFMQANGMAWEDSGFLLPKERLELMERFGIKDNGNSLFLMLQPGVADMLAPYSQLGVSSRYIERPDDFVTAWRDSVKSLCDEDPTVTAVSSGDLRNVFDSTVSQGLGTTVRDATAEFQEAQIMMKLGANYTLGEVTKNLLRDTANADVRGLLMQFGGISGYHLNPGRVEGFVQRLAEYKKKIDPQTGKMGDIKDFSPFAQGKWVGWALGQGYFQAGAFTKDEALRASETDAKLKPQGGKLSEEAKSFYASAGGSSVDKMLTDMGAGDAQKATAYELVTGNSERATSFRTQAGITVTGTGAGMTVSIPDKERAKACLSRYLRE